MSRSVNKACILGHLGKDAETKFTAGGTAVTNFSVATERTWKDKAGEWKKETDWHNIVLWSAEKLAAYLLKGTQVYVSGRLNTRSYEDRDGVKRYATSIIAEEVVLCGGGKRDSGDHNQETPASRHPENEVQHFADSDVPF